MEVTSEWEGLSEDRETPKSRKATARQSACVRNLTGVGWLLGLR